MESFTPRTLFHLRPGNRVKKILVIDDSPYFAGVLVGLFPDEFEVKRVRDGLEGLAAAYAQTPDMIFLDVTLPRISGIEVLRRFQGAESLSATPVIVLVSPYFDPKMERVLRREPNVASFVSKTCEAGKLIKEIFQVFEDFPDAPAS